MLKILQTEIWIDENHNWWNQNQKITNTGVLRLFKENLHFDDNYFIFLTSRNLQEKGYLKAVKGFPLLTENVEFKNQKMEVQLDNGKFQFIDSLFYDVENNLFWNYWYDPDYKTQIPFLFTNRIIQILSPFIVEDKNQYYLDKEGLIFPIEIKAPHFTRQFV